MFNPVIESELVVMFGGITYDASIKPEDAYFEDVEMEELEMESDEFFWRQLREVKRDLDAAADPERVRELRDLYSDLYKDCYGVRHWF